MDMLISVILLFVGFANKSTGIIIAAGLFAISGSIVFHANKK